MNINCRTEMKKTTINIITFLMLFFQQTVVIQAQTVSNQKIESKSALLNKGDIAYQDMKYSIAANYYENYLQVPTNTSNETLAKLADCYLQMRDYSNSLRVYKLLYPTGNQRTNQKEQIRIAELFARSNEYQQASEWLKGVSGYQSKATVYNEIKLINLMKKDSANWRLKFLNINTSYREFSPFLSNKMLFFSSNKPVLPKTKAFGWDGKNYARLWEIPVSNIDSFTTKQISDSILKDTKSNTVSKKLAEIYECGDNKPKPNSQKVIINQPFILSNSIFIGSTIKGLDKVQFNAGAISVDKNNHIYFSSNYAKADKNGVNRICIMEGVYSSSGISGIKPLSFGDNSYSVMHPAVNQDGTLLVFSSDKAGGTGGYDLYYTQRDDVNQKWDSIKAFDNKINTIGNEVFPTITASNYLYFSSDAAPGLGGLDIFRISVKDAIEGKGALEHLSYPINSSADDFGWTQDSTGTKGYFTSDRLNNDDNIYSFSYNPVKPPKLQKKSFIEGLVLEKQSLKPIEGSTVFLYSNNNDTVIVAKTNELGKYRFPVLSSGNVIIKAVDNKYINDCMSSTIVYDPQSEDTIQNAPRYLLLDKFKVGFVWKVSNIHYDFNKANIRADAMPILDSVVMVLNEHQITVELGSHTDSRGSFAYNDRLSQHRADAAVAYIISKGIDPKRITAKGYGERQLLNKCADGVPCSEEEHQANRRTEVKVTGYIVPQKKQENIDVNKFIDGEVNKKSAFPKDFFDECK
jgi:outer membrane protein OmpA-like peptidoglycan-associated protein/tetratricopeptide (TPR) repeat protein